MSNRVQPATTYPAIVGQILAALRQNIGSDQKDLAASLGLSQSALSRIERGETAITIEQLALLATKLKTTSGDVLQKADRAAAVARKQGIQVGQTRSQVEDDKGLVFIGVAALALIVASLLSKK